MIDCGHNSTSGWRPSNFLAEDTPDGKKANVAYFGPGMHAHGVIVDGDNIVLFKGKFPKEERLTVI
ncbi:hypothetical protein GCM10010981_17430 [Dyella nitratireducens]|uniref:Uncharacterized protein n=2 Tax=Dyella nitratireducens TaxID=1849580 RepID=A0ABQ1FSS5_9GAMM|nr:hypothetical protein GCM10010981_17430 [Dyella nitratireducens]GLQ43192.1 hypothetical protein GCM10007902_30420 [Dyella nitratireducens]